MRIIYCQAKNFGSYKDLSLNLYDAGLSLVYGRTGSGKSTLPDVVAWTLFGITAKDGAADDIRSWQSGSEATVGEVEVEVSKGNYISVRRIRGKGQNDLYFSTLDDESIIRGKDLTETQKLLEQRLGVTAELFIAASYYHEFSPTGAFFTAKAKDRRNLFEKLAPLELPRKLAERSSEERKVTKESHAQTEKEYANNQGQIQQLDKAFDDTTARYKHWASNNNARLEQLRDLATAFEVNRARSIEAFEEKEKTFEADKKDRLAPLLDRLTQVTQELESAPAPQILPEKKCPTCERTLQAASQHELFKHEQKQALQNSLMDQIEAVEASQSNYSAHIESLRSSINHHKVQYDYALSECNPFCAQLTKIEAKLEAAEATGVSLYETLGALAARLSNLNALYDLAADLRGELLKNAVKGVEEETNKLLDKHFDAEIRVGFELDSDSLNVSIQKSGFECNYKQLSKGQRGLLKLCFSVAVMSAASDRAGVHFSNLFLDEALDGLDSELKMKAFGLLQELSVERDSVLVIDHAPEFQNLFDNKYHVTLEGDYSSIEVEHAV